MRPTSLLMVAAVVLGGCTAASPPTPSATASAAPPTVLPSRAASAAPPSDPGAIVIRQAPADLACDSVGWPDDVERFERITFVIDPAAAEQVSAVSDTGVELQVSWVPGFEAGSATERLVRGLDGEVVARDGEVVELPTGSNANLHGYPLCVTWTTVHVLLTHEPVPAPASPAPGVAGLGPDALGIVVATDGLRVRSLPTVGDESERLEPTLSEGVRFYVVDGPVTADGYAWYQVIPDGEDAIPGLPIGWIGAGSREGEPWIEPYPLGCDSIALTVESLVGGEALEHLYCSLAGETPRTTPPGPDIAVEGTLYCTHADDHWGSLSGPSWIDQRGYCELRTNADGMRVSGRPIGDLLDDLGSAGEARYAIVGHFDDPEARECRADAFDGADPPDPALVVLWCRTEFIATEVIARP